MQAVYQPHLTAAVVASLRTAAAYGSQLDLAAYLRHAGSVCIRLGLRPCVCVCVGGGGGVVF